MPLKSGSIALARTGGGDWAGSLAKAMEDAYISEWNASMEGDPPAMNDQARLMFVAIAKGVVKHLKENGSAWSVDVHNAGGGGTHDHNTTTTISGTINP